MDPSLIEDATTVAIEDAGEQHSNFIELALYNNVVLREIFKFLPASTLKNCNLVNKLWRNECYSHCRDTRKCMAKIPIESPCASVREFNELIGSMTFVPYNGLSLHVDQSSSSYSCQCETSEDLFTNVLDQLTWRHLDIHIKFQENLDFETGFNERKEIPCAIVKLGMTLLEQKIVGLESLEFCICEDLQSHFISNWPPAMPKLKIICFPHQTCPRCSILAPESFFMRLTNAAPNLKEINGWSQWKALKYFGEEKWKYVKDFIVCEHPKVDDELKIALKFVSKRPALRKLFLVCAPHDDPIINELLLLSQRTLEHLQLSGSFETKSSSPMIALPNLPTLRVLGLNMQSCFGRAMEKLQSLLYPHGPNGFPQLEEVHFSVDDIFFRRCGLLVADKFLSGHGFHDQNGSQKELQRIPAQPFNSVSKLWLQLDPRSSFVPIHHLFPAVTDLSISCQWCLEPLVPSIFNYRQIFGLWQNLDRMTIRFFCPESDSYSLDSAFCGLHEEEVRLLQKEDDTFLMAVQLVPIAPCVLTMRNMVSFTFESQIVGFKNQGTKLTRVARMLARRYLPKAEVRMYREGQLT